MRSLFAFLIAVASVPTEAARTDLLDTGFRTPSSVSGWYDTGSGFVRLMYSRPEMQTLIDTTNLSDTGMPSFYLTNLYFSCPNSSLALPLAPNVWFAVKGATATTLNVQVGAQFSVAIGIGTPQTWTLVRPLVSPAPYTCDAPSPKEN